MQEQGFKRQTAIKTSIKDLINGKYVTEDGWTPNYILSGSGSKLSRVNLVGAVVSKTEGNSFRDLALDDGTGKIPVREFEDILIKNFNVGDLVLLIGRPRKYQDSVYIIPEIIRKMDSDWVEVRKREVGHVKSEAKIEPIEVKKETLSEKDLLFSLIKKMDSGQGVDFEDVVDKADIDNANAVLETLLKNGDLFEVSPGKLKILE